MDLTNLNKDRKNRRKTGSLELGTMAFGKMPPQAKELEEAVLGANVVLTQSTKIIDVSGTEPKEYKGRVPSRSVLIPGSYLKKFPAGEYNVSCALIIGQRKPSTDLKTSLNDALRDFNVSA